VYLQGFGAEILYKKHNFHQQLKWDYCGGLGYNLSFLALIDNASLCSTT